MIGNSRRARLGRPLAPAGSDRRQLTATNLTLSLWPMSAISATTARLVGLRTQLGLSQAAFASLFGAHAMTISRWERGQLSPTPYQWALIAEFEKAAREREVKETLGTVIVGAGIAAALYLLLRNSQE